MYLARTQHQFLRANNEEFCCRPVCIVQNFHLYTHHYTQNLLDKYFFEDKGQNSVRAYLGYEIDNLTHIYLGAFHICQNNSSDFPNKVIQLKTVLRK